MDNNDLIRRGAVLAQAYEFDDCNLETGEEKVSSAVYVDDVLRIPAVDAVEVVRCRECISCVTHDEQELWCAIQCPAFLTRPDDYCSRGKRREGGDA